MLRKYLKEKKKKFLASWHIIIMCDSNLPRNKTQSKVKTIYHRIKKKNITINSKLHFVENCKYNIWQVATSQPH